jgi:hypothetical protein
MNTIQYFLLQATFCYRRRFVTKTFCYRRRFVKETFCYGDVSLRRRFVRRRFVEETFCKETFCMCVEIIAERTENFLQKLFNIFLWNGQFQERPKRIFVDVF